jgi:hypothetical protein
MDVPALHGWAEQSGLTVDELARITFCARAR